MFMSAHDSHWRAYHPRPLSGRALLLKMHGFTLVELVMTIVLIGILAVVVLPRLDLLKGFDEVGYRDKVIATLQYARKAAVAQRRNVCVTANGTGLLLTRDLAVPVGGVVDCSKVLIPLSLPAPDTKYCGSATTGNEICAPSGVTLIATRADNRADPISISPLGEPSSGVIYDIKVNNQSVYRITVEAVTGYVH